MQVLSQSELGSIITNRAVVATACGQLGHPRATESSCFKNKPVISDLVPGFGSGRLVLSLTCREHTG